MYLNVPVTVQVTSFSGLTLTWDVFKFANYERPLEPNQD